MVGSPRAHGHPGEDAIDQLGGQFAQKEPFVSTTLPRLTDPLSALYLEGRDPRD
jgi:hypothetical protein